MIWKIYDAEKTLTDQLNVGQSERKAAADAAWEDYRKAKELKNSAYDMARGSRNREDWIDVTAAGSAATEAYNRAKNAGGEAGRSIKAERLLRNYRNYALGLAKDVAVPKDELQRAVEAYKSCVEALSEKNNSKTRSRLKNELEALRAQSERAAKRRRRQSLLRQLQALLVQKKKEQAKKAQEEPVKKPGLDSKIQSAEERKDSAAADKKPDPEREK